MSDQVWSMVVGAGVVVALRLLDWVFPRGFIFRKVKEWSIPTDEVIRDRIRQEKEDNLDK